MAHEQLKSQVCYLVQVKEYESGGYTVEANFGGGKVSLKGDNQQELITEVVAKALDLKYNAPLEPEVA